MYLRTTKRHNKDGATVEYYQLAETRVLQRRPTAHIIHNFGRAETLDRSTAAARPEHQSCVSGRHRPLQR